jgi:hypothetical protein
MWGSVDGHWFRVRAIGIGGTAPVADGYVVATGTGSRVVVNGEMDPEGTRLAPDAVGRSDRRVHRPVGCL